MYRYRFAHSTTVPARLDCGRGLGLTGCTGEISGGASANSGKTLVEIDLSEIEPDGPIWKGPADAEP